MNNITSTLEVTENGKTETMEFISIDDYLAQAAEVTEQHSHYLDEEIINEGVHIKARPVMMILVDGRSWCQLYQNKDGMYLSGNYGKIYTRTIDMESLKRAVDAMLNTLGSFADHINGKWVRKSESECQRLVNNELSCLLKF